jgi:hypothetical protein
MSRSAKTATIVALGALVAAAAIGTAVLLPSDPASVAGGGYLTGPNAASSVGPTDQATPDPSLAPDRATPNSTANPNAAGSNRSLSMPAEFTSALPSYSKLTDAIRVYNRLPSAGQATIGRISTFLAQNTGETDAVCTHLADVLSGKLAIAGLTIASTGQSSGQSSGQPLGSTGIPAGSDIEELAFIVLMQATNDQDNDLQEIMNETQAQTKAKQFLRQQMQIVNTDVANNTAQQTADANGSPLPTTPTATPTGKLVAPTHGLRMPINEPFYTHFQMPDPVGDQVTYHTIDLTSGQPLTTITQLQDIQTQLQGDLDSMNETSEATSTRLQMAMDRQTTYDGTLPQLLDDIEATYG